MLIPSIDLRDGKIVQLVQGDALALESTDIDGWVDRFRGFDKVQLIDLDAAMGRGENLDLVTRICGALPCRVGGGIRTVERARQILDAGAATVIVGSSFFTDSGPDLEAAGRFAAALGTARVIAAVDSRGGQVVVKGWRASVPIATVDAVRALDPYCAEFLYTHVDTEGLMRGIDLAAVERVRAVTSHRIAAAGGITTRAEIDHLDDMAVDAVVGMAIYTGRLSLDGPS
jgi:phosphoribosylformimino-5-aminoimidazole carboxamide ribotide isomerase